MSVDTPSRCVNIACPYHDHSDEAGCSRYGKYGLDFLCKDYLSLSVVDQIRKTLCDLQQVEECIKNGVPNQAVFLIQQAQQRIKSLGIL